ncbi:MAG: alpha-2-macroglobulin family protein, partial [Gammaproteobacteria bacterium]|nr:alpha-2-macroglobulin family protein [Gammaproteobacteria bacterium]
VGADGTARIPLDLPEFDGELRLMAVAFDARRIGAAAAPLPLRGPLVAQLTLPRFLAPGDESRATVSLHNVEAEPGTYRLALAGGGAVSVDGVPATVDLARDARVSIPATLRGVSAGIGQVSLTLEGPGGAKLRRDLSITVRPSRAVETAFTQRRLPVGASTEVGAAALAGFVSGTGGVRLTYGSRAPFDVAGILAALERYPYGCLEQVVSRALPLVGTEALESAKALASPETRDARVDAAVGQVLDKQRYDGGFGVWSAFGEESAWLTAYATELLARARSAGRPVAEGPYTAALEWLRRHAIDGGTEKEELASRAYAVYVLALAGVATPGPARYLHDAFLAKLPTPLARAQLAAALARQGDGERARAAAAAATENLSRDDWSVDYGSVVRDAAALVSVLGEADLLGDALPRLLDRLPASALDTGRLSTQEQAWVVRAAGALMAGKGPLALKAEGIALPAGDPVLLAPTPEQVAAGLRVTNAGASEVWEATTLTGVPVQPRPAAREGMVVRRFFFGRDGQPLNLDNVRQNDVFVVDVQGEASTGLQHRALLSHGLPAGWEIESVRLVSDAGPVLPWLGEVTPTTAVEARDDRYVAAFDLTPDRPSFRVAYLVRAVTPGTYELPGAQLEDMYRPRFFARQAVNRITVQPAQ